MDIVFDRCADDVAIGVHYFEPQSSGEKDSAQQVGLGGGTCAKWSSSYGGCCKSEMKERTVALLKFVMYRVRDLRGGLWMRR